MRIFTVCKLFVMKKLIVLLAIFIPTLFFAQSSRDINAIIQKTIDLHALKKYYSESEKAGETPLIIINDDKIPNNLIVFKFNKRVKIMTPEQLKTFKSIYKGDLDSYFVFEIMKFKENEVTIRAIFRKDDKVAIDVNMKKEDKDWQIIASSAE